jgi:hypothetical protein
MGLGGLMAVLDRRYRRQPVAARASAPAAGAAPARPAGPAVARKASAP